MSSSLPNHTIIGIVALCLYVASAWLLMHKTVFRSTRDDNSSQQPQSVWLLALCAAAVHALTLFGSTITAGGLNLSFFNALSLTTWLAVVLTLLLNMGRPAITLGLFLFPMAAATLLLSMVFPASTNTTIAASTQWHVLSSIVAYSLLTISTGQALLVSLQDKRLKSLRPGGFLRVLPPLKVMETVLFQLLLASFIFLSLALTTGFTFLEDLFAQRLVHKTTLSIIAWLLLALLLIGHLRWGWRGQKAAGFTLAAFVSLLLGYFGSKFVIELLLS